ALEGQVKMRAESRVRPEAEQLLRDVLSLQGRQPDTRHRSLSQQRLQERARPLIWPAEVAAVVAELRAGEDYLLDAVCFTVTDLVDHALDRYADLAAARVGDDAEGAE